MMKYGVHGLLSLMIAGTITSVQPVEAQFQKPFPTNEELSDPVASINPERPIQIRVVSQTDTPFIATLLQPATDDRLVAPGESVTFGRLHTSYLPLPIDMTAYVKAPEINLFFDVSTSGNEIIIEVATLAADNDDPDEPLGNSTQSVSVELDGLIYVY